MEGLQLATIAPRLEAVRRRYDGRVDSARLAWGVLGVLLIVAAAFLLRETRGTTLWFDEWVWALTRRGSSLGTYLDPHNSHLSLVPVALYKLLFATVGIVHFIAYRVMITLGHLIVVTLLFVYVRRRVGDFLAVVMATLVLFLGAGWQNIFWSFQIAWLISLGTGIGALLLLDRPRGRRSDLAACLLLVISIASSSIGIPVLLGVIVEVVWTRRRSDWWIVVVPIILYVAWSLGYENSPFRTNNLFLIPRFMVGSLSGAMAAILGLVADTAQGNNAEPTVLWGLPFAVVAVAAFAWRLRRIGTVSPRLAALITIPLTFWILDAAARAEVSWGVDSRYLYVNVVFVLLVAAEVMRGVRVRWLGGMLLVLVLGLSVLSNIGSFRTAAGMLRASAENQAGDLAALDILQGHVPPNYVAVDFNGYPLTITTAGQYYALKRAMATPADTPAQLAAAPSFVRAGADVELINAHAIVPGPAPPGTVGTNCTSVGARPGGLAPSTLTTAVPSSGALIRVQGGTATVAVRRFADNYRPVGTVPPGTPALLRIGPDNSSVPWHLQVSGATQMTVCAA